MLRAAIINVLVMIFAFCIGRMTAHDKNWDKDCTEHAIRRAADDVAFYIGRDAQRAEQAKALFMKIRREGCGLR